MMKISYLLVAAALSVLVAVWGLGGNAQAQGQESLVIVPSSGPCDGTVEVIGKGFPANTAIRLDLARPGSDTTMGKLGSTTTNAEGEFRVTVTFGTLGCEAAQLEGMWGYDPASRGLVIFVDLEERAPTQGIPPILGRVEYRYTTTGVTPEGAPSGLPGTGSGSGWSGIGVKGLALSGALAAGGLLAVSVGLAARRRVR